MISYKEPQAIKDVQRGLMKPGSFLSSFPSCALLLDNIRHKTVEVNNNLINFMDINQLDIPEDHNAALFVEWNY
jgi:hypothetical protein